MFTLKNRDLYMIQSSFTRCNGDMCAKLFNTIINK